MQVQAISKLPATVPARFLNDRLKAWLYLSRGPQMIQEGYEKVVTETVDVASRFLC